MEGRWLTFFEDGTRRSAGEYREGLKAGEWTFYYEDGAPNRVEQHMPGSWEVKWTAYREKGQKWAEGTLLGHWDIAGRDQGTMEALLR